LDIKCELCGDRLFRSTKFGNFCNQQHYETFKRKKSDKLNFICEICGVGYNTIGGLRQHLGALHKDIDSEEYYVKYILKPDDPKGKCLYCGKDVKFSSFTDGYNKFCYNTECNVKWYNKNSDRKETASKSTSETYKNHPEKLYTRVEYWLNKGFTEEESKKIISENQSTFSLKICKEKYGEIEGLRIWQERQLSWQKTLNNKSIEERDRIKRSVIQYSKVSQKLFDSIYDKIKEKYVNIHYATKGDKKNNEYMVITKNNSCRFLDFYIPEINKAIEFDGEYWHGMKRGNKKRDDQRDIDIIEKLNCKIFHVDERYYYNDSKKTVNDCLEFLNE